MHDFYCDVCGAELFYGEGYRHVKTGECRCFDCVPWDDWTLNVMPGWKLIHEEEFLEEEMAADAGTPTAEVQENQLGCADYSTERV